MSSCHTTPSPKKEPLCTPKQPATEAPLEGLQANPRARLGHCTSHQPVFTRVCGFTDSSECPGTSSCSQARGNKELFHCSALRDFGISRGCVCPCLPPPQTLFQSRILVQKMKTSCSCHWLQPFLNRKRQRVLCCSRPTALGRHLMNVGRWSNYPLEKQCWKGDQKKGGWRPASSLGSGQIYGIPQSSGQTGHPHINDTGFAGSDSTAWVMQEVRLR